MIECFPIFSFLEVVPFLLLLVVDGGDLDFSFLKLIGEWGCWFPLICPLFLIESGDSFLNFGFGILIFGCIEWENVWLAALE